MPAWLAPAIGLAGSLLGGGGKETTTEVKRPAWQDAAMQGAINNLQNAPVAQLDPDQLTANLNPYVMDALMEAGTYSQGAGADQVAMMNQMGLNQAGVGDAQAAYGSQALNGAGSYIMNELAKASGNGYSGGGGMGGGGGGGGSPMLGGDLKFQYDQGTYDQAYGNLIGAAQGAFDSFSNKAKTSSLFNNLPGLKMGSQLIGGSNTKVGQQSSLLDAVTNQTIADFGSQQAQWAAGQANSAAMSAGQGNQNTALGQYSTDSQAATSRANQAMASAASRANARMTAASNLYGQGSTLLNNAGATYGAAGNTFGDANTAQTNNMNTSMVAGDYVQQYDQQALDRLNQANVFNTTQPFQMNMDMYNAFAGTPSGSSTSENQGLLNQIGTGLTIGGQLGEAFPKLF